MDRPHGFERRQPRTGQSRPAGTIFTQYNIPGVGQDVRRCRTSTSTDPGQGKARQVCSARAVLCRRMDTVQCLPGADHLSTGEREKYVIFVQRNNTTKEDAGKEKLPINLAEKRTRRAAKMYASKSYYNFICSVESIYLTNLNIQMIRAYADSEIMDVILVGIMKNKHLESKFRSLCVDDVGTKEQQQIMKYLMERYANVRGTFFIKCIKNNNPKSSVDTLAARQAARSKVSRAVITAKAVAKVTEAAMWPDAATNVLEATKDK